MERRRPGIAAKLLKLVLVLGAVTGGAWFGRDYLPESAKDTIEDAGHKAAALLEDRDPSQLREGQRFVYRTGRPNVETRIVVTRIEGSEAVDVHVSMSEKGEVTPGRPPHQSWSAAKAKDMLRGMGLGAMREESITVGGVTFACQVYESSRVPFKVWFADRFPGVVRLKKGEGTLLELRSIEELPPSERPKWEEPGASWTLGF